MCHTCCDCVQEIGLHAEAKVFSKTEFSMISKELDAEIHLTNTAHAQQVHHKAIALSFLLGYRVLSSSLSPAVSTR